MPPIGPIVAIVLLVAHGWAIISTATEPPKKRSKAPSDVRKSA